MLGCHLVLCVPHIYGLWNPCRYSSISGDVRRARNRLGEVYTYSMKAEEKSLREKDDATGLRFTAMEVGIADLEHCTCDDDFQPKSPAIRFLCVS